MLCFQQAFLVDSFYLCCLFHFGIFHFIVIPVAFLLTLDLLYLIWFLCNHHLVYSADANFHPNIADHQNCMLTWFLLLNHYRQAIITSNEEVSFVTVFIVCYMTSLSADCSQRDTIEMLDLIVYFFLLLSCIMLWNFEAEHCDLLHVTVCSLCLQMITVLQVMMFNQ